MRNFKNILGSGAALGALMLVTPAVAQDAEAGAEQAEDSNAIIVTARRQNETLAEVPTAITSLGISVMSCDRCCTISAGEKIMSEAG